MAWIFIRHLDKASQMSCQTNLLKGKALKHKDATWGGKLWAVYCQKLRGCMGRVLPYTDPGPLLFPRLLQLADARGLWDATTFHMADLMSCSWGRAEIVSYKHRTENWAAVLQKRSGLLVDPKLNQNHRIIESSRLEKTFKIKSKC